MYFGRPHTQAMNEKPEKEPIPSPFFHKADPIHEALIELVKNKVIVITISDNGADIRVDNFNITKEISDNTIMVIAQTIIARRRKEATGT